MHIIGKNGHEKNGNESGSGRLEGKVAIVTGGATGIGEAICHKFCREGAKVVVCGFLTDPVQDVVKSLTDRGYYAVGHEGDISEEQHARDCVAMAINSFGKLDILINNAGVFLTTAELDKYPVADFDLTVRMNLRTAFLMTHFALPYLQKSKGCIVSAGSEAGFNGLAQNAPYGGTKGFMHAFMKGVAVEQAKYGVRANCVAPGAIDTAWTHKETGPMDAKMEKLLIDATPMARRGTPEEMANVYCFLASDEASYVTGAVWLADGGVTPAKGAVGMETPKELQKEPDGPVSKETAHQLDGLKNKTYHSVS